MAFISNTTPTPNWLLNGEMRKMNETELKVVMIVVRKTLGWFDPMTQERKQQDNISQSQFMEFTGKSHTAIANAIQSSVENGWIIAKDREGNLCDTSNKRRRRKVWYQLGSVFTRKISKQQSGQDRKSKQHFGKSKQHNDINLSNKVDNTKETITKETIQKIESTPKQKFLSFLKIPTQQKITLIEEELKRNLSAAEKTEIENFISYWTELSQNGTKQRWQLERTFDYLRRVKTWFQNISKFNNKNYGNNKPKSTKYSGQHKQAA